MKILIFLLFIVFASCKKCVIETLPVNENLKESVPVNTDSIRPVFSTLSRDMKPLIMIAMIGNSLIANGTGGGIPAGLDEGNTRRPVRLTYNNISRRIYDYLSWNKASHFRLDNPAWTKMGDWYTYRAMFEPSYPNEWFHKAGLLGSYAEITIPDGKENFAFIIQRNDNLATVSVTLNGGDISPYGPSTVNCHRHRSYGEREGNAYHVVQYHNLPAGANKIRITKTTTGQIRMWGGLYWTGNTLIVHNLAHGSHTIKELMTEHLKGEVQENNYDALVFEVPIRNELSTTKNDSLSIVYLKQCYDKYFVGKDCLIMTASPLGTNPVNGTNYFIPTQKPLTDLVISTTAQYNFPLVDIYEGFRSLVIANGSTLESGGAGIYTTDGSHPNPLGVQKWWEMILPAISNNKLR